MKKTIRDGIIEKLIDDDIDTITQHYAVSYIGDILREGFKGYKNYTKKELEKEYNERFL